MGDRKWDDVTVTSEVPRRPSSSRSPVPLMTCLFYKFIKNFRDLVQNVKSMPRVQGPFKFRKKTYYIFTNSTYHVYNFLSQVRQIKLCSHLTFFALYFSFKNWLNAFIWCCSHISLKYVKGAAHQKWCKKRPVKDPFTPNESECKKRKRSIRDHRKKFKHKERNFSLSHSLLLGVNKP